MEKYNKFLNKCRAPNLKYYYKKQMRIEDELTELPEVLQEGLAQYL